MRVRSVAPIALALSACTPGTSAQAPSGAEPSLSRLVREPLPPPVRTLDERIVFHRVRLDGRRMLVAAHDAEAPFADVVRLGFHAFETMPDAANGKKPYFAASMFTPSESSLFEPHNWLANPTGLSAMLVRASLRWYAWSGDRRAVDAARALVDHVLSHGRTTASDAWALVPYASANAGELEYRGGDDTKHCDDHTACGRGDGRGFLEPDKVGEFGHALVLLHRFTGDARYLEAAIRCADALAAHAAPGDGEHSPWPFRVDAKTGKTVREPYTSNWIYTVAFFDALDAIGKAGDAHKAARQTAWNWLTTYPMTTMHWQGFFEDIPIYDKPGTNPNQYSAGETARWLLDHRDALPDAVRKAKEIALWIETTFAVDVDAPNVGKTPGHWYGATVISEQKADMAKMSSHTARYASLLARLYELTGDADLRARARRSFAWSTYCVDDRGVVKVGPDDREGYWFSDGYGDFMIHFLDGIASVPAWAPSGEAHVLRSTDVIVDVEYGASHVRYRGAGPGAEEVRVPVAPKHVTGGNADVTLIPGGGALVTVRRAHAEEITIAW